MNVEEIRDYCVAKDNIEECFPFGIDTIVFKVNGKIFLLMSLSSSPLQFNAKCEPLKSIELREKYSSVLPGYHMNKKHWNTVICDGQLPKKLIFALIDESYFLVSKH